MKKIVVFLLLVSNFFPSGCTRPKQYADYSRHSGFDRTEIDSATLRNLEVLGRVWGFVKYHHPAFSDDRYRLGFEPTTLTAYISATSLSKFQIGNETVTIFRCWACPTLTAVCLPNFRVQRYGFLLKLANI